jgi:oligoribonuclease (3'-5' exoribonuclease)
MLKAAKDKAAASHEASKEVNKKLYNESIAKSKTLFNFEETKKTPFTTDAKLSSVDAKYQELEVESNKAFTEGNAIAFKASQDYALTDNIDAAEFGIKAFQMQTVKDYQSRGKALTSELHKGYESYLASVQDIKVPTEFGMLSLQDVQSKANKDPARYDAVKDFHEGAYYWSAGVFGGKNALSSRNQLALLKLTQGTDKVARAAFIKSSYEEAKKEYDESRQNNLADQLKGAAQDPDAFREVIFGNKNDPNSGYIAQHEKISGKKDVAGAIAMLEADLKVLATNRSLKSEDLARLVNIKGISARDGSGTKTLKEFNEPLHSRLEGLLGTVAAQEAKEKEAKDVQSIRELTEAATERLNGVDTGATEVHLEGEVKQIKNQLRDRGIDVSEGSLYYKYFQPLLNYHTKDDARDEATKDLAKHATDEGFFREAEQLIKSIRDPGYKKEATTYFEAHEPIKNNKKEYDVIKGNLDTYIKSSVNITSTTQTGTLKSSVVIGNATDHFNQLFLNEIQKKIPVKTALQNAFEEVKKNLDKTISEGKPLRGGGNTAFGNYYVTGAGRYFDGNNNDELKRGGFEYKQGLYAFEAGKQLANPDTKNEWLNLETPHDGEPVNQLVQYANGGRIPQYYIEASKHLRFTTAHDLIHARLGSLGYDVEQKLLVEGGYLKKLAANSRINKLLSYMPSPTKTQRAMFEMDGKEGFFSIYDNFVVKTKDKQFGNKSDTNDESLEFETIPINDTITQSIKHGYGMQGFGQYKINRLIIADPEIEKLSGLDYSKDALTVENQQRIIRAKNMRDASINNSLSFGFSETSNLNDLDMEGIFDSNTNVHNLPYTISPELLGTYFLEIL